MVNLLFRVTEALSLSSPKYIFKFLTVQFHIIEHFVIHIFIRYNWGFAKLHFKILISERSTIRKVNLDIPKRDVENTCKIYWEQVYWLEELDWPVLTHYRKIIHTLKLFIAHSSYFKIAWQSLVAFLGCQRYLLFYRHQINFFIFHLLFRFEADNQDISLF